MGEVAVTLGNIVKLTSVNVTNSTVNDDYDDVFVPHVSAEDRIWAIGSVFLVCLVFIFAMSQSKMWKTRYFDNEASEEVLYADGALKTESIAGILNNKLLMWF